MPRAEDLLFRCADALLYPCLAALGVLAATTVYALGRFAREALARRRAPATPEGRYPDLAALVARGGVDALDLEAHLAGVEERLRRRVERLALAAKIGPMCGLMGTLIPLGPALLALGEGSLGGLGRGIAVAFSTTVIGLAVAGPCHAMATVRRRWYEGDLAEMDVFARRALEPRGSAA